MTIPIGTRILVVGPGEPGEIIGTEYEDGELYYRVRLWDDVEVTLGHWSVERDEDGKKLINGYFHQEEGLS